MPDSPTPQPAAPAAAATTQETPTTAQPANPRALDAAVRRTVALKNQEAALLKKAESLKPMEELAALMKTDPAAAFERLAGENYLEAYKAITNKVVGSQDEQKALEALPKSVRERLAKVEDLEKRAALVDELSQEVKDLKDRRTKAEATLLERQKQETASRVYSAGFQAVEKAAAELPLLLAHPQKDARLQARWVTLMGEKAAEMKSLTPEQRQAKAQALVLDAARAEQKVLEDENGWVLQTPWARGKMLGKGPRPSSAPATSASTPATPKPPRTGTPTSLGEPSAPDLRKMTLRERVEHLKALERSGTLFKKS